MDKKAEIRATEADLLAVGKACKTTLLSLSKFSRSAEGTQTCATGAATRGELVYKTGSIRFNKTHWIQA